MAFALLCWSWGQKGTRLGHPRSGIWGFLGYLRGWPRQAGEGGLEKQRHRDVPWRQQIPNVGREQLEILIFLLLEAGAVGCYSSAGAEPCRQPD